jgi:hypothetical protein
MNASYGVRLTIQCLDSFFLAHLLLSALLLMLTPVALWCSAHLRAGLGAWVLFFLRVSPVLTGVYVAFAIALPSYVTLEPDTTSERVDVPAMVLAAVSLSLWLRPMMRSAVVLGKSRHFVKGLQNIARPATIGATRAWLVSGSEPYIAVAGVLCPRVLVSESLAQILTAEELQIALLHETAHQRSRDNLKRLCLLLLPDPLPFISFGSALQRAWTRLVEWAADDYAAGGDRERSMLLACALVRFARYQSRTAACGLTISLVDHTCDLAVRVERLLGTQCPKKPESRTSILPVAVCVVLPVTFAITPHFANLPHIHQLLEFLSHFA